MAEFSEEARRAIWAAVHEVPAVDMRVFARIDENRAGGSGVDALLTSPAILAELCRRRAAGRPPGGGSGPDDAALRSLSPTELADLVWGHCFADRAPLSEPARRILTALGLFGIDVGSGDLRLIREQYRDLPQAGRLARCLQLANVDLVLSPVESMDAAKNAPSPAAPDGNFRPVLYLSELLGEWRESARRLRLEGYGLKARIDEFTPLELRRHLAAVAASVRPVALGLDWPAGSHGEDAGIGRLVREAVLPFCRERGHALILATGETPVERLASLWERHPDNRFLLVPGREDQMGEAVMAACGARNLLLCGGDGILGFPHAMESFTARRLETLGGAFHACHSGAYRAEELVGAWAHLRWSLGEALVRHFTTLGRTGWRFSPEGIRREVALMLGGNLRESLGMGKHHGDGQ